MRALADAHAPNTDLVLTGPEALGYDDDTAIVTEATGRRVVHQRLAPEQMRDRHAREMPLEFATMPARYGQVGAGVPRVARSEAGRVAPSGSTGVAPAGWHRGLRGEHQSGRAGVRTAMVRTALGTSADVRYVNKRLLRDVGGREDGKGGSAMAKGREAEDRAEGGAVDAAELRGRVRELLAAHPPGAVSPEEFLRARFDAGLAWVHFPRGLGGLGAPRSLQPVVDAELAAADAPDNDPRRIGIGLGMAAPTILRYGTEEQKQRFLRPLWTGEEPWCQLFSEPGAGSDLAGLRTRAVREPGGDWIVDGQKVWTSSAHTARWAILIARTDPDVPKHQGITYFVCDMTDPGVEVRPLRQLTGEAEFNEVFLTGVRIPDAHRLGAIGDGWRVAQATLMNERVAIGGRVLPREAGMVAAAAATWRERPELRTPELHDRLLSAWVDAEVARLSAERVRQQLAVGSPGPEGAGLKLAFARLNQRISGLEVELLGEDGLRYGDWTMVRPRSVDFYGRDAGYRYLRAKGNSIEGGTSEILRNIIAERVLELPAEPRTDKDAAWKDLPR